jgi:hypothetical protein
MSSYHSRRRAPNETPCLCAINSLEAAPSLIRQMAGLQVGRISLVLDRPTAYNGFITNKESETNDGVWV